MLRWSQVNFEEQQITVGKAKSEGGNRTANSDVANAPLGNWNATRLDTRRSWAFPTGLVRVSVF
jgi:hypothetical protein